MQMRYKTFRLSRTMWPILTYDKSGWIPDFPTRTYGEREKSSFFHSLVRWRQTPCIPLLVKQTHRSPLDLADPLLVKAIWKPEVYFPNAKEANFQFVTVPNVLIRIHPGGEILYILRWFDKKLKHLHLIISEACGSKSHLSSKLDFLDLPLRLIDTGVEASEEKQVVGKLRLSAYRKSGVAPIRHKISFT